MRTRTIGFVTAIIAGGLLGATTAHADLTGTYGGGFKCKWTSNDGSKDNETTKGSTLKIIHNPDDSIDVDIDGTAYCGRVIATNPGKKGVGVFIVVGTDGNPNNYNEIEYISWKTTGKARVKKKGFWVDSASIGECRGGWSRQSEDVPAGNFGFCNFAPF
jgi:hypothetical protein